MKYSLISFYKLSSAILVTILLTACPSPTRMKKAFEMQEKIKIQEKYENLFNESVNEQESDLSFFDAVDDKFGATIYLDLADSLENSDWQEDLMHFQRKLRQTNTRYEVISIYEKGRYSYYVSGNLEMYELYTELFQKNLMQIKQGKIEELYQTMGNTKLKYETIKELLEYVKVTRFDDTNLIAYPSHGAYGNNTAAFSLVANSRITLCFSYDSTELGVILQAIDLVSRHAKRKK